MKNYSPDRENYYVQEIDRGFIWNVNSSKKREVALEHNCFTLSQHLFRKMESLNKR